MLFFAPDVLHRDAALMRVLVDKHFVDSWVLAWAPGFTSDIAEEWANYKARSLTLHGWTSHITRITCFWAGLAKSSQPVLAAG